MIKKLKKPKRGRPAKYPWKKWCDGAVHRYRTENADSFVAALRYHARTYGYEVVAPINGNIVRFQFTRRVSQ